VQCLGRVLAHGPQVVRFQHLQRLKRLPATAMRWRTVDRIAPVIDRNGVFPDRFVVGEIFGVDKPALGLDRFDYLLGDRPPVERFFSLGREALVGPDQFWLADDLSGRGGTPLRHEDRPGHLGQVTRVPDRVIEPGVLDGQGTPAEA